MKIHVIFKTTDHIHAEQYEKLKQEYQEYPVIFHQQKNFRSDLLGLFLPEGSNSIHHRYQYMLFPFGHRVGFLNNFWLRLGSAKYLLFLVDDNIFVKDFFFADIKNSLEKHPEVLGFSLRLGVNTLYSYMLDKTQSCPQFKGVDNEIIYFDWTVSDGDFGYPLEVSSSVYRIKEILPLLNRIPFSNPNSLESSLSRSAVKFVASRPKLLSYKKSVAFCNPVNKVQTIYATNRAGSNPEYHPIRLTQLFEEGYRLCVGNYSGYEPKACHEEVELILDKKVEIDDV